LIETKELLEIKVVLEDIFQSNNQTTQISDSEKFRKIVKELNEHSLQNPENRNNLAKNLLDLCNELYAKKNDQKHVDKITKFLEDIAEKFIIQHIHPQTHLLEMKNSEGRVLMRNIPHAIIETAFQNLIKQNIAFPFKKFFETPLKELFSNLQNYKPTISNKPYRLSNCRMTNNSLFSPLFDGQYVVLSNLASNYQRIDLIGDYFTEEQRLKSIRSDEKFSPLEYWKTHFMRVYIFSLFLCFCVSVFFCLSIISHSFEVVRRDYRKWTRHFSSNSARRTLPSSERMYTIQTYSRICNL
jgi:hypothetical protein